MASARRGRGEGTLYWDDVRSEYIAERTVGYAANGKRIKRRGRGKTKTIARDRLKQAVRAYEAGLDPTAKKMTVTDAVDDFLRYGLGRVGDSTRENYSQLTQVHVVPKLGQRRLSELTACEVEKWLASLTLDLSTRSLRLVHGLLNRAVRRAVARHQVERNVVALVEVPIGRPGRASKSLTLDQAKKILAAATDRRLYAYVVVSLLTGARTEELRALRWGEVDLAGSSETPPSIRVWRSIRAGGDTKTRTSRRTLALPKRCVDALRVHRAEQVAQFGALSKGGVVFCSTQGTPLDHHNVRRAFRNIVDAAELTGADWTPRELRHSLCRFCPTMGY